MALGSSCFASDLCKPGEEQLPKGDQLLFWQLEQGSGIKKKRKKKIWINIFHLVSQSRKRVQTLLHLFLAAHSPPGE